MLNPDDVTLRLKETFLRHIEEVEKREKMEAVSEAATSLHRDGSVKATARQYSLVVDEPEAHGGADAGPTPEELALSQAGSCQSITASLYAALLDIGLRSYDVELRGEVDRNGGISRVETLTRIDAEADEDKVRDFQRRVEERCVGLASLRRQVEVESSVREVSTTSGEGIAAPDVSGDDEARIPPDEVKAPVHLRKQLTAEVKPRHFSVLADWPPFMGGVGAGPTSEEILLSSLGACQTITVARFASARGVPLSRYDVGLKGNYDLSGLFGIRVGMQGLQRVSMEAAIEGGADEDVLRDIHAQALSRSLLALTMRRSVPIESHLEVAGRKIRRWFIPKPTDA